MERQLREFSARGANDASALQCRRCSQPQKSAENHTGKNADRADEHLVQNTSQSEDVGARIHLCATDLLGSHVAERPYRHSRLTGRLDLAQRFRTVKAFRFRQTEVEDLHMTVAGQKDVCRLEI